MNRNELFLSILVMIALAVGWGFAYVGPNDDHLKAVMECTNGNPTFPAWEACHNKLVGSARGLVPFFHPPTQ